MERFASRLARNYSRGHKFNKDKYYKSKKGIWRLLLKIVYVFLFLLIIGAGVYALLISSVFRIKGISVKGNNYITSAAIINSLNDVISEKKWFLLKNDNINLFDLADAKKKIMIELPRIDGLDLKKDYPNKITVDIREREMADTLCQGQDGEKIDMSDNYMFYKCFFIDKNGIAFDVAADTQGFLILKIIDKRGEVIELNKKVLNPEFINFVGEIKSNFRNSLNANIKSLILEHPSQRELVAVVDDWKIIFNVSGSAKDQLMVLKQVLEKEVKDQRDNLEYIDLRIDGRAYYKLK